MKTGYFTNLSRLFTEIKVSDKKGKSILFEQAVVNITTLIADSYRRNNKVIIIGNGGSASIASHIYTDLLKNANVRAICFNDASLITCLSNDLGYEYVFQKPIEMLSSKGDILFSISSSGRSRNILKATFKAKERECSVITLSGFSNNNPLKNLGEVNFYVPSHAYGDVEITHLAICHAIVDNLLKKK